MKFDPTKTLERLAQMKVEIEQICEDVPWLETIEVQILTVAASGIAAAAIRINARCSYVDPSKI